VALYELCREAFPDMDEGTITTLVSGGDLLVSRPDAELRRLAALALELGLGDTLRGGSDEAQLRAALGESDPGARWLAAFDEAKDPWFYFSYGNGLYNHHRSWIDDTSLPLALIASYVRRLEAAEGRTNKEVAAALFMGVSTVESHLSHVYRKLGIRSRAQLAGRLAEPANPVVADPQT
jgi:pyruvate,water dikinase